MKKTIKASFTVETVLIMPFVLFVILLLTEYIMVLHDRIVTEAILSEVCYEMKNETGGCTEWGYDFAALSKQRMFFNDTTSLEEKAENAINNKAATGLLFSELWQVKAECGTLEVKVSAGLSHRNIVPFLGKILGHSGSIHEISLRRYDREAKTRLADIILKTVGTYFPINN